MGPSLGRSAPQAGRSGSSRYRPSAQLANPNLTFIAFNKETGFKYETDEVYVSIGMKQGNEELAEKINKILEGITPEQKQEIMETAIKNQPLQQ